MQQSQRSQHDSVSLAEIDRFGKLAKQWWDPDGPMRPLHRMNPLRISWTDRHLSPLAKLAGRPLRVLDLGCGAGLASEALATLGHEVIGVDASVEAIAVARAHAPPATETRLSYRSGTAEALLTEDLRFDAVVALEVIEHVTDPAAFLSLLARLLSPGGIVVISTLNRTWKSLAVAKIGAEYILRMLPAGTHDWRKFVSPTELASHAAGAGLRLIDIAGMVPSLSRPPDGWRISQDLGVNYIAALARA